MKGKGKQNGRKYKGGAEGENEGWDRVERRERTKKGKGRKKNRVGEAS